MKKLVSLLLVLAIAVTLVACGGSKPAETQAPAAPAAPAAPETEEIEVEVEQVEVEVDEDDKEGV